MRLPWRCDWIPQTCDGHSEPTAKSCRVCLHAFAACSGRTLPIKQRLEIYDAYVGSTLLYATMAAGPGKAEIMRIHAVMTRRLRFMALSPRHITHESKASFCQRLGRQLPLAWLLATWEKQQAWLTRRQRLNFQDISWCTPPFPPMNLPPTIDPGSGVLGQRIPVVNLPRKCLACQGVLLLHRTLSNSTYPGNMPMPLTPSPCSALRVMHCHTYGEFQQVPKFGVPHRTSGVPKVST